MRFCLSFFALPSLTNRRNYRPTTPNPSAAQTQAQAQTHANGVRKSLHAVAQAIEVDLGDF